MDQQYYNSWDLYLDYHGLHLYIPLSSCNVHLFYMASKQIIRSQGKDNGRIFIHIHRSNACYQITFIIDPASNICIPALYLI